MKGKAAQGQEKENIGGHVVDQIQNRQLVGQLEKPLVIIAQAVTDQFRGADVDAAVRTDKIIVDAGIIVIIVAVLRIEEVIVLSQSGLEIAEGFPEKLTEPDLQIGGQVCTGGCLVILSFDRVRDIRVIVLCQGIKVQQAVNDLRLFRADLLRALCRQPGRLLEGEGEWVVGEGREEVGACVSDRLCGFSLKETDQLGGMCNYPGEK